jgi:hypothetical protein
MKMNLKCGDCRKILTAQCPRYSYGVMDTDAICSAFDQDPITVSYDESPPVRLAFYSPAKKQA